MKNTVSRRDHEQSFRQPNTATTNRYTIGEVATRTNCTPEGIRYYEKAGVIAAPERSSGNYRRYSLTDIETLQFIRSARELGFSLDEVRSLLALAAGDPTRPCRDVSRVAQTHLESVTTKLADLLALQDNLKQLIAACHCDGKIAQCGILGALRPQHS